MFSIVWNVAYQSSLAKRKSNEPCVSSIEHSVLNETTSADRDLGGGEEGDIHDILYMLINKQLSSSDLKSKQIGLIGALMLIKNMAKRGYTQTSSDITSNSEANNTTLSNSQGDDYFSCKSFYRFIV